SLASMLPGFLKPRVGSEDFYVENGCLNANPGVFERNPVNLVRIFQIADAKGVEVHPAALRTITRSLDLITDEVRHDPEANRLFLEILASRRDLERALRRLNEAGVFGRLVPEFGRVVALMQFNMYHHYTVDEHLIRAVGNVAAIERGELKAEHPLASEIIKRIQSREALYCAILLHDIAKGLPGDHSDVGAAIAHSLCPRWGLSRADTDTVAWLVRNHLVMSDTAQRRDISDPKTVRDFVNVVQSPETLRLLLVLTVADIRAVGPGVWNGWKGQLLRELYAATETVFRGGRISDAAGVARRRLEALAYDSRTALVAADPSARPGATAMEDADFTAFSPGEQARHLALWRRAEADGGAAAEAKVRPERNAAEVTVSAHDREGLFADLAQTIAELGGNVVGARIFTSARGEALDIF